MFIAQNMTDGHLGPSEHQTSASIAQSINDYELYCQSFPIQDITRFSLHPMSRIALGSTQAPTQWGYKGTFSTGEGSQSTKLINPIYSIDL